MMPCLRFSLACAVLLAPALPLHAAASLAPCLAGLRANALKDGISAATWERYTAGLEADPSVLEAQDAQPEFVTPIWDYQAALVDAERIADGQRLLEDHATTLRAIEAKYGVDPATVVAVWGVESDYGRVTGKRPLLTSLATLSCASRRQEYFRPELFAALKILQAGDVQVEKMQGSWAGAFGQTQFMPSTYLRLAVDFDGDGRRDLIDSTADALASTANYLAQAGWRRGERWGMEVRVPSGFDERRSGRRNKRTVVQWARLGVTRADGSALAGDDAPARRDGALLLPSGKSGPALLVWQNYDALFSYNAAESYALSIALLSDRLRGQPGWQAAWPTDDPGLSRAERRELQTLLTERGHAIGEIDGMIGKATRAAIASEQRRLGWTVDSRAGQRLLRELRHATR